MKYTVFKSPFLFIFLFFLIVSSCKKKKEKPEIPNATLFNTTISTAVNGGPFVNDCGGFEWKVNYTLDSATTTGGYFIQEIIVDFNFQEACPTENGDLNLTYYEAWRVNPNQRVTVYIEADPNDYDDVYTSPENPGSRGIIAANGDLRYFDNVVLGPNMIPNNPNTFAGILPSESVPPVFWNDAAGIPHNVLSNWNCCTPNDTTTVTWVPQLEGLREKTMVVFTESILSKELNKLLPWTSLDFSQSNFDEYIEVAKNLKSISNNDLIKDYITFQEDVDGDIASLSKLYILTRVIYDIPDAYPRGEAKSFGGWIRELTDGTTYNLLWPVTMKDENLIIEGEYDGYIGIPYNAVGELQYMIERFPRRDSE